MAMYHLPCRGNTCKILRIVATYQGGGGVSCGDNVGGKFSSRENFVTSNFAAGASDMGNFAATEDAQRAGSARIVQKTIRGGNCDGKLKYENFPTKLSPYEIPPQDCFPCHTEATRASKKCVDCG